MTVKFVSVLALLITVTSTYADGLQGAVTTASTTHPYYVSIEDPNGVHNCGGALIDKDLIISSAYCVFLFKGKKMIAHVGSGEAIPITGYYYDAPNGIYLANDIGLLKLAKPITVTASSGVIKVASSDPKTGGDGVIVDLDPKSKLAQAPASIMAGTDCVKHSGKQNVKTGAQVCAMPKSINTCKMATGSPLVANKKLVGVLAGNFGCPLKATPAVYMNVAAFNSWIKTSSQKIIYPPWLNGKV